MTRSKAVTVTVAAAVAVVIVTGFALYRWRDIAIHYHLWKLRNNPDYLAEILQEPEHSPEGTALMKFIQEPPGKTLLLQTYLNEARDIEEFKLEFQNLQENANASSIAVSFGEDVLFLGPSVSERGFEVREYRYPNTHRYHTLQLLLGTVGYFKYPLSEHPGLVFTVANAEDSNEGKTSDLIKTLCLIERSGHESH